MTRASLPTTEPLTALIPRIAGATTRYPFKRWGFGESIAMEGLLAAGGEWRDFAETLIVDWATTAPPLRRDPLAHVAPGVPLLHVGQRYEQRERLLERAEELANLLVGTVTGRHGAHIHRPDLAGWEHEVWVDCMHLDGPFLALLAQVTGDPRWADHAAELLLSHARVLQDEQSGLFSHGFNDLDGQPNRVHWGRGQGWALLGLVDTAAWLPADHLAQAELRQRLQTLVDGLARTEVDSGCWHTVVDATETYLEASVPAFVTLGVGRAVRRSLVSATYQDLVDRAWTNTHRAITASGELSGVSDATPVGPNAAHYSARPTGVFPWGQGPALLAAIERLEGSDG